MHYYITLVEKQTHYLKTISVRKYHLCRVKCCSIYIFDGTPLTRAILNTPQPQQSTTSVKYNIRTYICYCLLRVVLTCWLLLSSHVCNNAEWAIRHMITICALLVSTTSDIIFKRPIIEGEMPVFKSHIPAASIFVQLSRQYGNYLPLSVESL